MKAVAYLKTTCGWSAGVREVLSRYNIDYEEKIINLIRQHIKKNVNKDGIHISMNPCYHAEYINNLYEIKNIMLYLIAQTGVYSSQQEML